MVNRQVIANFTAIMISLIHAPLNDLFSYSKVKFRWTCVCAIVVFVRSNNMIFWSLVFRFSLYIVIPCVRLS